MNWIENSRQNRPNSWNQSWSAAIFISQPSQVGFNASPSVHSILLCTHCIPQKGSSIEMTHGEWVRCFCPNKIYYTSSGDLNLQPHDCTANLPSNHYNLKIKRIWIKKRTWDSSFNNFYFLKNILYSYKNNLTTTFAST